MHRTKPNEVMANGLAKLELELGVHPTDEMYTGKYWALGQQEGIPFNELAFFPKADNEAIILILSGLASNYKII